MSKPTRRCQDNNNHHEKITFKVHVRLLVLVIIYMNMYRHYCLYTIMVSLQSHRASAQSSLPGNLEFRWDRTRDRINDCLEPNQCKTPDPWRRVADMWRFGNQWLSDAQVGQEQSQTSSDKNQIHSYTT